MQILAHVGAPVKEILHQSDEIEHLDLGVRVHIDPDALIRMRAAAPARLWGGTVAAGDDSVHVGLCARWGSKGMELGVVAFGCRMSAVRRKSRSTLRFSLLGPKAFASDQSEEEPCSKPQ